MFKIDENGVFTIIRGDSAELDIYLPIVDESGEIIGEYTLEPGDSLLFTVKRNTKTTDRVFQKSGQHIAIEPSDTAQCPYGKYKYDVQLTYSGGFVDTVIPPTDFIIAEEVTF